MGTAAVIRTQAMENRCNIVRKLLSGPLPPAQLQPGHQLRALAKLGIVYKEGSLYHLNLELVRKCSYIVPDDLYEKLGDRDYVLRLRARARGEDEDKYVRARNRQAEGHKRIRSHRIPLRQQRRIEARNQALNKDEFLNLEDALFGDEEPERSK